MMLEVSRRLLRRRNAFLCPRGATPHSGGLETSDLFRLTLATTLRSRRASIRSPFAELDDPFQNLVGGLRPHGDLVQWSLDATSLSPRMFDRDKPKIIVII